MSTAKTFSYGRTAPSTYRTYYGGKEIGWVKKMSHGRWLARTPVKLGGDHKHPFPDRTAAAGWLLNKHLLRNGDRT